MAQYEYLILMAACVAITLPLEFLFKARVYRRPLLMLPAVGVVVVVFGLWDLLGIVRNHWTYNEEFITGIHIGPMPLEELVFFVVISLCALLSYEGVSYVLRFFSKRKDRERNGATDAA